MIPDNIKESMYEPFGDEWKKEVSKLPKSMLIEQWRNSCLKVQQKDEKIKELETNIISLYDALIYFSQQYVSTDDNRGSEFTNVISFAQFLKSSTTKTI